jgi:S1-C subfamily serine protease
LTANHNVVLSVARGIRKARVHQGRRVWEGKVVRTDPDHDIALIRVPHRIAPAPWQKPVYTPPLVGDELLLVGSPLGYEGSVTSGVVGRVAFKRDPDRRRRLSRHLRRPGCRRGGARGRRPVVR